MLRFVAVVATIAVGATAVYAQNLDVIKQRREAMQSIAGASFKNFKMMKGEAPFDLATVQAGLKTMQEQGAKFKGLFADDSKTGGGTDADAKIWTARADFNSVNDQFVATAKTAAEAIKDEATFKTAYPKVAESCGGCHKATDGFTIRLGDSFKKPTPYLVPV